MNDNQQQRKINRTKDCGLLGGGGGREPFSEFWRRGISSNAVSDVHLCRLSICCKVSTIRCDEDSFKGGVEFIRVVRGFCLSTADSLSSCQVVLMDSTIVGELFSHNCSVSHNIDWIVVVLPTDEFIGRL